MKKQIQGTAEGQKRLLHMGNEGYGKVKTLPMFFTWSTWWIVVMPRAEIESKEGEVVRLGDWGRQGAQEGEGSRCGEVRHLILHMKFHFNCLPRGQMYSIQLDI